MSLVLYQSRVRVVYVSIRCVFIAYVFVYSMCV